jgi:hypothetical protein
MLSSRRTSPGEPPTPDCQLLIEILHALAIVIDGSSEFSPPPSDSTVFLCYVASGNQPAPRDKLLTIFLQNPDELVTLQSDKNDTVASDGGGLWRIQHEDSFPKAQATITWPDEVHSI